MTKHKNYKNSLDWLQGLEESALFFGGGLALSSLLLFRSFCGLGLRLSFFRFGGGLLESFLRFGGGLLESFLRFGGGLLESFLREGGLRLSLPLLGGLRLSLPLLGGLRLSLLLLGGGLRLSPLLGL